MSSFFESLNFQPEASGSGTQSSASNRAVRSPRQASSSSSSAVRIDRDTTAPNELDNATRVFWAVPPSTFVQNWRANNPPQTAPAATNDDDQGLGDQARQLLVSADQSKLQDHRWSRHQSNSSSTSSTASSRSTKSRRVKSLRASKAEGSFRRHTSSSAALTKSIYEDEDDDSSSQLGSDESFRRSGSNIRRGGEAKTKVQRLLADLSLRVQQIDREDEDQQGQDEFDEGDLTMLLDCVDESSPCGKGFDPPSSGTIKLSPPKRSIVTSSWERAVTFPPTGSPAGSTGRGSAVHVSTPLAGKKSMDQATTAFEDQSDDGFDLELDESLLVDLPMLSGKADSAGFFDSIEQDIAAISTPPQPVPSPTTMAFNDSVQHQALPAPQASPSSETMSNRPLTLGKRRDPPTPGGVSDTQEEPQGMTTRRQTNSNRSSKARSISPTKPQKGSALAPNVPSSSRGPFRVASASSMEQQASHPASTASPEAAPPVAELGKTRINTRQSSRSPQKQQRKNSSTSASTSPTATHLPPASRKMSNPTTTTIPRLSQGVMGSRRPGLSRGSVAGGGFKPFRPPTRKIPVEELLLQSSAHQGVDSNRYRSTSSTSTSHMGQRRGESQWTTAGEDSSFDDDDEISLDAEELEKVMSAKGY